MSKIIQIYDSTLRDGGYINNWDFPPEKINAVYDSANMAKIDYVEVGYIDKIDTSIIKKEASKIMVMVDYNKINKYSIPSKQNTNIDGIRVACHKPEIEKAIKYTKSLKSIGYITAIQIMAITNYNWEELESLIEKLNGIDIVSLADSNGSLFPKDIKILSEIFNDRKYLLNLHAHDNLSLAFANSIEAIDCGFDMIDCSYNGIGRGAGNLPTELFLSYLNKYKNATYDISDILEVIDKYILPYKGGYSWGYNIPHMFSGFSKIHPYYGRDVNKYHLKKAKKKIENIGKKKPITYKGKINILCVIPARYDSTRFPGKLIKKIKNKTILEMVYNNATKSKMFTNTIIATDSSVIMKMCKSKNMKCIKTSDDCASGTDRIKEVSKRIDADLYVNLQGDEPLITPDIIDSFIGSILSYGELNRLAYNSITYCTEEDVTNPNVPKVVVDTYGDLLYMSRYPIPYDKSKCNPKYLKELGLHAYTKKGLEVYDLWDINECKSELAENLEFLRFLEAGKKVRMIHLDLPHEVHAIDVPSDVKAVEEIMKHEKIK